MKRILIIITSLFFLEFLISCCDNTETTTSYYIYDNIETIHIDNSGKNPVYLESGEIPKRAYGIQITKSISIIEQANLNLTGFSTAFATSWQCPPEFEYIVQDSIIDLKITTLNDFDNKHLSYSDISSYFSIYKQDNYLSIGEYLSSSSKVYFEQVESEKLEIYLMQAPEIIGKHQFKVEISLSNGSTLSSTTTAIILK